MEKKKTALIVGMARSGCACAKLLYHNGWRVIINDMKPFIDGLYGQLEGVEFEDALGRPPEELLDGVDMLVLSPVIPIFSPFAKQAADMGIEVVGEIELGYRFSARGSRFVCITGTNGKTTTTSLTGEIFIDGGGKTFVLGNLGLPIAEYAPEIDENSTVVAETAALQLESTAQFHANAAGFLNITEDHLNRFQYSMDNYIAAKCRIFRNQTEADFAVLNYDDVVVRAMSALTKAVPVYFSQRETLAEGMFMRGSMMIWRRNGVDTEVLDVREMKIPGAHNVENALCAASLALCMDVPLDAVKRGLREFPGVEHRIEFVREIDGIRYINDSKATNPDSTIQAIRAMTGPTILLLGVGEYDKKSDFSPVFRESGDNIAGIVCSGLNAKPIMETAARFGFDNIVECKGDIGAVLDAARSMAKPGYTILLSPAAASWGQFSDYEERGRVFKKIVRSYDGSNDGRK